MRVGTQLAVFLENKPGTLADMCEALGEKGINILAISCSDAVDHGVVRILTDRPDESIHVLGNAGMMVVESEVLVMSVSNEPGALARVARRCAAKDINIEYAYCTVSEDQQTGSMILRTRYPQRALNALSD